MMQKVNMQSIPYITKQIYWRKELMTILQRKQQDNWPACGRMT